MKNELPLPEDKKLTITYRVEPGCLGPEGKNYIVAFCEFSQTELRTLGSDYLIWDVVSRSDKSLPEMQYTVVGKRMSYAQAEKYLALFGQSLGEFEGQLGDKLATLIDEFLSR